MHILMRLSSVIQAKVKQEKYRFPKQAHYQLGLWRYKIYSAILKFTSVNVVFIFRFILIFLPALEEEQRKQKEQADLGKMAMNGR